MAISIAKKRAAKGAASSAAFTILFAEWQRERLEQVGAVGAPLRLVFGGYNRDSKFPARFKASDRIYALHVRDGALYLAGRLRVGRIVSRDEVPAELGHLVFHSCAERVALADEATTLSFERAVPPEVLARFRWKSPTEETGVRAPKFVDEDGRITRPLSFQGFYELTEATAGMLDVLLEQG